MFLEELESHRRLPRELSQIGTEYRQRAKSNWDDFVTKLRNPSSLDSDFFVILERNSEIAYLDQVSWFDFHIAGFDVLNKRYLRLPEETVGSTHLDFGYLENGLLRCANWLSSEYLDQYEPEEIANGFVLPGQLDLDQELYEHFAAIARHDQAAVQRISNFSATEIRKIPFKLASYVIEEFSPLGYAVAYNNLEYVNAAASHGIQFAECRSFDGFGLTHLAVRFGGCAMLRSILSNGGAINDLDSASITPLEIAVHDQQVAHADCLLAQGADPNFGIDSFAIEVEHAVALNEMSLEMYKRLRSSGTRFEIRETDFLWTPLHYNAKRFRRDTFIQMVKDGLDPHAKDYKGRTPFDSLRSDVPKEIFDDVYRQCVRK